MGSCDVARHDVVRLLLMVPLEPWQNSTPFLGAEALCTTKIGDFRTSSTLSSLTTWLRRPSRKDQFRHCSRRHSTKNKLNKVIEKKIQIENVVIKMKSKMKSKLNQNIGMSVSIAVVNTVQKQKKIKFLNR